MSEPTKSSQPSAPTPIYANVLGVHVGVDVVLLDFKLMLVNPAKVAYAGAVSQSEAIARVHSTPAVCHVIMPFSAIEEVLPKLAEAVAAAKKARMAGQTSVAG